MIEKAIEAEQEYL
jgi:hypothetical protein